MSHEFLGGRLIVKTGDITLERVDAIVNSANSSLLGGGGVDGAIHLRGGPSILQECREIRATRYPNGLPTGQAVITTAGDLSARHVIHTVGPIYGVSRGDQADSLAACYANSIELAVAYRLSTLAFPSISTGAFGYPKDEAAEIVSKTLAVQLDKQDSISLVKLVFFSDHNRDVFSANVRF